MNDSINSITQPIPSFSEKLGFANVIPATDKIPPTDQWTRSAEVFNLNTADFKTANIQEVLYTDLIEYLSNNDLTREEFKKFIDERKGKRNFQVLDSDCLSINTKSAKELVNERWKVKHRIFHLFKFLQYKEKAFRVSKDERRTQIFGLAMNAIIKLINNLDKVLISDKDPITKFRLMKLALRTSFVIALDSWEEAKTDKPLVTEMDVEANFFPSLEMHQENLTSKVKGIYVSDIGANNDKRSKKLKDSLEALNQTVTGKKLLQDLAELGLAKSKKIKIILDDKSLLPNGQIASTYANKNNTEFAVILNLNKASPTVDLSFDEVDNQEVSASFANELFDLKMKLMEASGKYPFLKRKFADKSKEYQCLGKVFEQLIISQLRGEPFSRDDMAKMYASRLAGYSKDSFYNELVTKGTLELSEQERKFLDEITKEVTQNQYRTLADLENESSQYWHQAL